MCASEPFAQQPNPGFCSGFFVGEDLFVTAGHCIRSEAACAQTAILFDYGYESQDRDLSKVAASSAYKCKSIVSRAEDGGRGKDYAVIRLDRVVTGREAVKIRRTGDAQTGESQAVIGHPSGLPTKISAGASVRANDSTLPYYVANLDTYGGNSGSAVFNLVTGDVDGILVRGETDFDYDSAGKCYKSRRCAENGCRGEDVSKASTFRQFVPE